MNHKNKYISMSCGAFSYGKVQGDMRTLKRGDLAWFAEPG